MGSVQYWLVNTLTNTEPVATFMRTAWGWPIIESIHFMGLTLLFGSIAAWDLRLLGLTKRVPIDAFHRLVPFAVLGFVINAASGSLFLLTEPDQYFYNPAFHFKLLFMMLAGLNVLVFYTTVFRRMDAFAVGDDVPVQAKFAGAASLCFWIAVIICGRLLTFYRPFPCEGDEARALFVRCLL
ncbi:MAG: hypothetical protein VYE68_01880 [Acidobacteriota bacterium]|nr:hypothetical protein [Acidobacteriota bacterium]